MADLENFGKLKIDVTQEIPGWTGYVPFLDYWSVSVNGQKLNERQQNFFDFIKSENRAGRKVDHPAVERYLYLYKDELKALASKVRTRDRAIEEIRNLKVLYNFRDTELDEYLNALADRLRALRINKYKRGTPARWIPLGESVDAEDHHFTRGGFYLGDFVNLEKYNELDDKFSGKPIPIEGPVINLNPVEEGWIDRSILTNYSTFVEMSPNLQESIMAFLKGDDTTDINVLRYYLSGLEFRLLADPETPNIERIAILRFLCNLYRSLQNRVMSYKFMTTLNRLICFSLARFFTSNPSVLNDDDFNVDNTLVRRAMIYRALSAPGVDINNPQSIASKSADTLPVPFYLPDVYNDAFKDALRKEILESLDRRLGNAAPEHFKYEAFGVLNAYMPVSEYRNALNKEALRRSGVPSVIVDKVVSSYGSIEYSLYQYKHAFSNNAGPLARARFLPAWCDPNLMPDVEKELEEILPKPGQIIRSVTLSRLLHATNFYRDYELTTDDIAQLNANLYSLGIRIACGAVYGAKFRPDEPVMVYNAKFGDMPKRGTVPISIYLIAWMLSVDKVTELELSIVDDWLKGLFGSDDAYVPTLASFRWLVGRKLLMSAKRKSRAGQLSKYVKRRDELVRLLLALVADPQVATPKRMKRLEAIYSMIGLDPTSVHSDLHRMATQPHSHVTKTSKASTSSPNVLDKSKLKVMAQSTQKAQEILSDVFVDSQISEPEQASVSSASDPTLVVLELLINNEEWSREDFEKICQSHGDTAGSMLERLNDLSYDTLDEPVAEEDDNMIYIDLLVARQLLTHFK